MPKSTPRTITSFRQESLPSSSDEDEELYAQRGSESNPFAQLRQDESSEVGEGDAEVEVDSNVPSRPTGDPYDIHDIGRRPIWHDRHTDSTPAPNYDEQIQSTLYGRSSLRSDVCYRNHRWAEKTNHALVDAVKLHVQMATFDRTTGSTKPVATSNDMAAIELSLDWDMIAGLVGSSVDDMNITADSCWRQWVVNRPQLERNLVLASFTEAEHEKLLWAVREWGGRSWDQVARHVGGRRTALDCFKEHLRTKHWSNGIRPKRRSRISDPWTDAEDAMLQTAWTRNPENWAVIAAGLPTRTQNDCRSRFRALEPEATKRGTWTPAEDQALQTAIGQFGQSDWHKIAECVPGRDYSKCKERYYLHMAPSKVSDWRTQDYERFRATVNARSNPRDWSSVVNVMNMSETEARRLFSYLKTKGWFKVPPTAAAVKFVSKRAWSADLRHAGLSEVFEQ
ncbi:Myb-like DNA-binding domain protein [Thoreauomyces humboldtii]|nr:Myb-like DNA-binding domain protein [Thoreauomyces humboldtii]